MLQTLGQFLLAIVGGGFVGSFFTTRMTLRHQREQSERDRAVPAADEFLVAVGVARGALERLYDLVTSWAFDIDINGPEELTEDEWDNYAEKFGPARESAESAIAAARDVGTRLAILFSEDSGVYDAATALVSRYERLNLLCWLARPSRGTPPNDIVDNATAARKNAGEAEAVLFGRIRDVSVLPPPSSRIERLRNLRQRF